jgi:hypothetical protein
MQAAKANMSRSEKFVTSLAAALLIAGFATEAFVKSVNMSMHEPALLAHVRASQVHSRGQLAAYDEGRSRALRSVRQRFASTLSK